MKTLTALDIKQNNRNTKVEILTATHMPPSIWEPRSIGKHIALFAVNIPSELGGRLKNQVRSSFPG